MSLRLMRGTFQRLHKLDDLRAIELAEGVTGDAEGGPARRGRQRGCDKARGRDRGGGGERGAWLRKYGGLR